MTQEYSTILRGFLSNYLSDESLKKYRQFVNVYAPREEDIEAINSGNFEVERLEIVPSAYGEGNMIECAVGKTSFRIWGDAFTYIEALGKKLGDW